MIDLNKIINESLAKIEAEGYVQVVVEKRIKETIESVVTDCLRSYSDFGKNLKKEVESKLNINLKELDFSGYNLLVLNAVKEKLDQVIHLQGIEKVKDAMDKMLADVKPEYTLSEIIESLRTYEKYSSHDYEDRMTLFIVHSDTSDDYIDIYLDSDKKDRKFSCDYQIRTKDGGIVWNVNIGGRELNKNNEFGALFGPAELLFKIYATGAKIILDQGEDEDDYNLSYHKED